MFCRCVLWMQEAAGGAPIISLSSPQGFALCQHILKEYLPYDPYNFQIEVICKAFDGADLLAMYTCNRNGKNWLSHYVHACCTSYLKKPTLPFSGMICVREWHGPLEERVAFVASHIIKRHFTI